MPGLAAAALAGACVAGTEPPVPASIEVSPPSATLPWFDETVQLTATVLDTAGRTLPGVTVAWTSEDALVATVDATGLVTAVAAGVTFVRAGTGSVEGSATVTVAPDRRALLILYDALGGSGWLESENWGTDAPLDEWHGVAADSKDNVLALELSNNGLSGTIPPEIGTLGALQELQLGSPRLTGEIPPEIGNLDNLRYLHLSDGLTGAIPPEIGNLQNLRYLDLRGLSLTGAIPPETGNLQNLRTLQLWGYADAIPPEIGNLQNLRYLHLSGYFNSAIPPELGNLQNLRYLYLLGYELTGAIPSELGNLQNLRYLNLHGGLTGAIPPEIGNLQNLRYLNLTLNDLAGAIPPEIGSLDGLDTLNLSHNDLAGPVPPEIGNLRNLLALDLHQNTLLSGRLPRELIGISLRRFYWFETDLCSPRDAEFQEWLARIPIHRKNRECPS